MKIETSHGWFIPMNQDVLVYELRIKGNHGVWLRSTAAIGSEWRNMTSRERSKVKRQRIQAAKQSLIKLYKLERLVGTV